MKKKIAMILAGLMLFSCVGCGKATADPESSEIPEVTDTVVTPTEEPTHTPEPEYYLRDLFAEHGMKVGTCLNPQMINTKKLSEMVVAQFNSVTMENAMKPDSILNKAKSKETGDIVVEFGKDAIKMLDWAKENGMAMRGHTLVWHSQTPDWIFYEGFDTKNSLVNRQIMLDRMDSYFKQVFSFLKDNGYSDMFYAYDIANECWMEDGSMRQSKWLDTIGEDYLWEAFNRANKYAPENIDLYYNDYNEQFKTETLKNFIQTLKDADGNYLIDGIGFQAHLYTMDDLPTYFKTVDSLSELGLKIELTELDVCLGKYQGYLKATEENLKIQGQYYYDLIGGILERVDSGTLKTDALTFWGFNDTMSWRKEASPLLFDATFKPKYAFYGAMQMKDKAGFDEN